MNPFEDYVPKRYCEGNGILESQSEISYITAPLIISPKVNIKYLSSNFGVNAQIKGANQILYDTTDLLWWVKKRQETSISDEAIIQAIKGVMGERMLSLIMEYFLTEINQKIEKTNQLVPAEERLGVEYGIIKERGKHRGKGYIARFNNEYLLRFKGVNNFVILKKDPKEDSESSYQQEMFGLQSTEIDGLAYLHLNQDKYLLVGESSTKKEFKLNSWNPERHRDNGNFLDRVLNPLKSLFPNHNLIYFVVEPNENLFDYNYTPIRLKEDPKKVYDTLLEQQVQTIFAPFPDTKPTLLELATQIVKENTLKLESMMQALKL